MKVHSKNIAHIGASLAFLFLLCGLFYQHLLITVRKSINFGALAHELDLAHHNYVAEIISAILGPFLLITVPVVLGLAIAYALAKRNR